MPNNFRITSNRYVSKAGSDANNGTTANTPRLTIGGILALGGNSASYTIGTGVYKEAVTSSTVIGGTTHILNADTTVKLLGNTTNSITLAGSSINATVAYVINNFIFENYLSMVSGTMNAASSHIFNGCTFINIQSINFAYNNTYTNCIFINCVIAGHGNTNFNNCIFINTTISGSVGCNSCRSSYLDNASVMYTETVPIASNFVNNNVEGGIKCVSPTTVTTGTYQDILGNYYDLTNNTAGGTGTISNPYRRPNTANATFTLAVHQILYPTLNVNSFNSPPLFNSLTKQDFSLQANSPHIGTGLSGSNVGGTNYAVTNYLNSDLEVVSGNTNTTNITFQWANSITTVGIISPLGLLAFDKSQSGGSTENKNVPDFNVFAAGDATGSDNPDRLTFEMRWTTSATQPSVSADWTNGGLLPAGTYGVFEWFKQPYVDIYGVTSGIYNFNSNVQNRIDAIWVDIRVTVRNNYL